MSEPVVVFNDVTYAYWDGEIAEPIDPLAVAPVFAHLSVEVPAGVTSVIGENGAGKSTFLLLAAARLQPQGGRVTVCGVDTARFANAVTVETERNRLVSFVYQNMEFETEQPLDDLLHFVLEQGDSADGDSLLQDCIAELLLAPVLTKRLQDMSKGEQQRAIIAFSLLYGSRLVMMDEPVFALEQAQKDRALAFLRDYAHTTQRSLLYSVHELDLTRSYADWTLMVGRDRGALVGPTDEMCSRESIEALYKVPLDTLYRRENLFRDMLLKNAQ